MIVNNLVNNMWILFTLLSVLKAITFSLNEPVKELLYIPTSEAIKFKAKAWIDVFGARCAKAFGSYITYLGLYISYFFFFFKSDIFILVNAYAIHIKIFLIFTLFSRSEWWYSPLETNIGDSYTNYNIRLYFIGMGYRVRFSAFGGPKFNCWGRIPGNLARV